MSAACERLKEQLRMAMEKTSLACTADVWTDKVRHISYLGVTAHFAELNEEGKIRLQTKLLGLKSFDAEEKKDGKVVKRMLRCILSDFNLDQRRYDIKFVTDRGGAMVKALEKYERYNCIAHLLNNIVQTAVKPIIETITKISRIVKYLKVTGLNTALKIRLVSYVTTRWNSVYDMLETFLTCWIDNENILLKKDNEFILLFRSLSKKKISAFEII